MLLLCRHMHIEYYFLSVIALSAVDHAKRMMHSLTQGSENQRSKSCKCLSMWRKPSQGMMQASRYSCVQGCGPYLADWIQQKHAACPPWAALVVVGRGCAEGREKDLWGQVQEREEQWGWSVWNQMEIARWGTENARKPNAEKIDRKTGEYVNLGSEWTVVFSFLVVTWKHWVPIIFQYVCGGFAVITFTGMSCWIEISRKERGLIR